MKIGIFLLFILLPVFGVASGLKDVIVTAEFSGSGSNEYLSFEVKNSSESDIEIYKSSLPWGNLYSATLIVCLANMDQTELKRVFYFDDPPPGSTTIKGRSEVTGQLDLGRIFPSLHESRRKDDVLVFWSYVLKSVDGKTSDRFGGMVVVPKDPPVKEHR